MRAVVSPELARLAAHQLQTRTSLWAERDLRRAIWSGVGDTGLRIALDACLQHLHAGVEHVTYAELHEVLLGPAAGRAAVAEQIATLVRLEEVLRESTILTPSPCLQGGRVSIGKGGEGGIGESLPYMPRI
jgi:hypothetical protein